MLAVQADDATPWFAAAAVAAMCWAVLAGVVLAATRARLPEPGPAVAELGAEAPAIAGFLTHRWHLAPSAASATLLDLAARRFCDLEQVGPGRLLCRLYRHRHPSGELAPHERRVLELVTAEAAADGTAAVGELTTSPGWWKGFEREVVAEARRLGLARRRWSGLAVVVVAAGLAVPAALAGVGLEVRAAAARDAGTAGKGDDVGGGLLVAGVAWAAVLGAGGRRTRAWRDTPSGRVAAARWLGVRDHLRQGAFADAPAASVAVRERSLAYAAALGVARAAVVEVPLGPRRDDEAWSAYGGLWREVRIEYPHRLGYGDAPGRVVARGLWWTVAGAAVLALVGRVLAPAAWGIGSDLLDGVEGDHQALTISLGVLGALVLGAPVAFGAVNVGRGLLLVGRGLADRGDRLVLRGQVVRLATRTASRRGGDVAVEYVAVDGGSGDELRAFKAAHGSLAEGDVVEVVHTPRLRHVVSVERLEDETRARRWASPAPP